MTMNALFSLLVLLGLTQWTLGHVRECGGSISNMPFDNIIVALEYYSRCTFPTYKLTISCILSSCPLLSGVCPLTSSGSANWTALKTAVSIINTCLGQKGLICGVNMSHIQMVDLGWTTYNFLPVDVVNGTIMANPGSGFLDNLSNANFTALRVDNGTVTLAIEAINITNIASHNCNFTLAPGSFLRPLTTLSPSMTSFYVNDMFGFLFLNISAKISIDLKAQPPTITTLDDHSNHTLVFNNFVTSGGFSVPADIVDPFNQFMNMFLEESVVAAVATTFLSTYAALALQAAQIECSS